MAERLADEERTAWIMAQTWVSDNVLPLLTQVPSGRRALQRIEQYAIPVFRSSNARLEYTHLETGEKTEWYLYGWTHSNSEAVKVFINSKMDDFTAAATLVHEIEHAQWYYTQSGGYEEHARIADLQFYLEHDRLHFLPDEYFTRPNDRNPVVRNGTNGLEVDWLEVVTRWGRTSKYSPSSSEYSVDYLYDSIEHVILQS
jgi:hypothetical protein